MNIIQGNLRSANYHDFGEVERNFYLTQLGLTEGSTDDLEQLWLQDVTGSNETDVTLLWRLYLTAEGYTIANLRTAWKQFLEGNGYSGNIIDQTNKYFIDNS